MAKDKYGLTIKQKAFCLEYHKLGNATQAAIKAGYSARTAYAAGNKELNKVEVQNYLALLSKRLEEKCEISAEKVLKELSHSGFLDPLKIFNDDGTVKPISEIPEDIRRAIAGIDVQETFEFKDGKKEWNGYIKKIKFWDKPDCLGKIQKQQGYEAAQKIEHKWNPEQAKEVMEKYFGVENL